MKSASDIWIAAKTYLKRGWELLQQWDATYRWGKYLIALLLVGTYTCGQGDYTLWRYVLIKQREYRVSNDLDRLIPRFVSDSLRLENIRTNPEEIEYIAREKYYMKSPGEEIYILKLENDRTTENQ
ncbi:MAG: septum formation initiator family protein [Porphyromonadaceae bacterium]|nr:septum formation initiator family protein [Porphyromonadaceae bacterium]